MADRIIVSYPDMTTATITHTVKDIQEIHQTRVGDTTMWDIIDVAFNKQVLLNPAYVIEVQLGTELPKPEL